MRTGLLLRPGLGLLVIALLTSAGTAAQAQSQRLGVIGVGAFGRLGSVPRAFDPGVPVALEATVQWPVYGILQMATSVDLTLQRIGTQSVLNSPDPGVTRVVTRPHNFDVAHFSAGPGFTVAPNRRVRVSGSAQVVAMVPSWGSASVGRCAEGCTTLGPSTGSQQTELHWGAAGRLRVTFGKRNERVGLELFGTLGPRHAGSSLPLSFLALMLVVGAS